MDWWLSRLCVCPAVLQCSLGLSPDCGDTNCGLAQPQQTGTITKEHFPHRKPCCKNRKKHKTNVTKTKLNLVLNRRKHKGDSFTSYSIHHACPFTLFFVLQSKTKYVAAVKISIRLPQHRTVGFMSNIKTACPCDLSSFTSNHVFFTTLTKCYFSQRFGLWPNTC